MFKLIGILLVLIIFADSIFNGAVIAKAIGSGVKSLFDKIKNGK